MPSAHHVKQVAPQQFWPGGDSRPLAVLRLSLEELTRRYRLVFVEDYDDLDYYRLATVLLPDGSQVWLTRYRHEPEPGTTVTADATADFPATLRMLASLLGPSPRDFTWVPSHAGCLSCSTARVRIAPSHPVRPPGGSLAR